MAVAVAPASDMKTVVINRENYFLERKIITSPEKQLTRFVVMSSSELLMILKFRKGFITINIFCT